MEFDDVFKSQQLDIEYGCCVGDNRIVFIKSGLGGNHVGYASKYVRIARRLQETYGCSVIVASNPNDQKSHAEIDKRTIDDFISENGIETPQLFFMGHSNGGFKGLEMTSSGCEFQRMLLVNMPLMINVHKIVQYLKGIPQTHIRMIYGEFDPSISLVPLFRDVFAHVKVEVFPRADHNFKGLLDEFIGLSDILFVD